MPEIPVTIESRLVERLNAILDGGEVSEIELASLQRDAQALINANPALAYQAFGMIATIKRDPDAIRLNFDRAIALAPKKLTVLLNYAASLNNVGFYREAYEKAANASANDPTDVYALDFTIGKAMSAGFFRVALNLLNRRESLGVASPYPRESAVRECADFLVHHGISDTDFSAIVDAVANVLHGHKIFRMTGDIRLLRDDESVWLSASLRIDRPVEDLVELNFELAEKLASMQISDAANTFVNFSYLPAA